MQESDTEFISIRGARQNNLKNVTLALPTQQLIVVTGVSGSGKSSLVFDTLYAEGQRRYVETFSPYARQFLDRMDKPQVDAIDGIPPAIAIDQVNPVRTSRSTVGTMTELNDHLKLLYARAAQLYCGRCAAAVKRDTPQSIFEAITARSAAAGDPRLVIAFPVTVPRNFSLSEVKALLAAQGYTRFVREDRERLEVVQDRLRARAADRSRVIEALEAALKLGQGRVNVQVEEGPAVWRFSSDLHCADCDIHYLDPAPSLFSFNSPLGACETCRGFGRVIGIDYDLIVPDGAKSLGEGAVRPWQTPSYRECQDDLVQYAKKRGIPLDTPWRALSEAERRWVLEGEPEWMSWRKSWPGTWYGVARFFKWLETKAYKMHIRVLLSKYRAYTACTACGGARLKPEALFWRLGSNADAQAVLAPEQRNQPCGAQYDAATLAGLPGLTLHDLALLPIERCARFIESLSAAPRDEATALVLAEVRTRLRYLTAVGLGYLTLDRQSRTLSGGEVQRINLTTALGTSLVNALFVLDEPSIGLHPRDIGRVVGVMQRLRDAGNTLVVVEHDPQVMLAADRILDMGPGPGECGGQVVFFGTPDALKEARTLTAEYLTGRRCTDEGAARDSKPDAAAAIAILGAAHHNLKGIDVRLPLHRLVCITGVSGSGKSTLIQDVLYPALLRAHGRPTEAPGAHRALEGAHQVAGVVLVDQSAIGRTTRSTPASYVGAFDAIRARYARLPLARERGYTAATFSFNSGNGRCPGCGGNGYEHVEMQFLSDVYLRCADCDGRRFRPEVLEVDCGGRSIADVLDLTVTQALECYSSDAEIVRALQPLADVGLDYLKLGQPVPTLSGGEAQRLKLAGHLATAQAQRRPAAARSESSASASTASGLLFLFDEPTTGLHFDDVRKLLGAFRQLLVAGHTLIVIEHNLDVVRAADWIVDLGPEGGDAGGEIVCSGTPAAVAAHPTSHTGQALREYRETLNRVAVREPAAALQPPAAMPPDARASAIRIHNAREHNLRNVDVEVPLGNFTVITGVSGSGKSTLAFDILFAEGQRRYLESLNAYARQFVQAAARPDIDAISGIPPTVAIEQRVSRGGRKSTVATLTEIYHFLRLLYAKLGRQHCPDCDVAIEPQTADAIAAHILRDYRGTRIGLLAPLVRSRKGYYTDLARWAAARGHSHLRVDGEFLPTAAWPRLSRFREHTIELPVADVRVGTASEAALRAALNRALEAGRGVVHVVGNLDTLAEAMARDDPSLVRLTEAVYSTKRACPSCRRSFPEPDPRLFSFNSKHGWCATCYGTGLALGEVEWNAERSRSGAEDHVLDAWLDWLEIEEPCPACQGRRLNREALAVRYRSLSIAELTAMPVARVRAFFEQVALEGREAEIARDILAELRGRLRFLAEVGLSYLALDRAAPTLSGGEAQRIRLAAQLGSNLRGVCYVLDEPTIGLHARDNAVLLDTLERLQAKGNTLVVVEHDEDTIRRAAHVIDLGPGAGKCGGRVIATGSAAALMQHPDSITGRFLAAPLRHPLHPRRRVGSHADWLEIVGADLHNLKDLNVRVPLGRLVAVTGVSGSGKSTLARDVLYRNLLRLTARRRKGRAGGRAARAALSGCRDIVNFAPLHRVLEVDQTPIGKTPRSCPATYVGFWDRVRQLFAEVPESRMRGYTASRFSFNTAGGRCDHCEGQGMRKIEMSFLPDVKVPCERCHGARFDTETLAVRFKERSIGEVLAMDVDGAVEFFSAHPAIHRCLKLLQEVGLGYLTLGQQSPTLSGGEAQRIKLVTELAKVHGREGVEHTLYVLDEPTVGLHMADVEKLIRVLHQLVDAGNTVVVIEHNLDVIAECDWIIDLGPEAGDAGGRVVAAGAPEQLVRAQQQRAAGGHAVGSHTARVLAEFLARRETEARAAA
ncbi:MAG TPA: excinuclease ABC subunit UvrA [Burkholderiales bacterium]|nr:excinuclease ABC subunit UvrA [Burkholderiales bacterium]